MKTRYLVPAIAAVFAATPAHAEAGDFLLRARAILVAPNERSGTVQPSFQTSGVSVSNSVTPEVDLTWFATDHIGVELIAATTRHKIGGTGDLAPIGKLAHTWVLPPTLTLQYHFAPKAAVRPYVGAGVNYTHFYSAKASSALAAAIGSTDVHLKDSAGYDLQAGVDVQLKRNLFLNLDVKYIDMDTTARLTTGSLVNNVKVHIDPVVAGVGLGFKF